MPNRKSQRMLALLRASELLDAAWYLREYPDVVEVGLDASEHFLRVGADLGRSPGPAFDTGYYVRTYGDVARSGMNPLLHYLLHGRKEGRDCMPRPLWVPNAHADDSTWAAVVARITGRRMLRIGRPTVLVCGHTAGRYLFGGERSLLDIVQGLDALEFNVVATLPLGGNPAYADTLAALCRDVLVMPYPWWRAGQALDERAVALFARAVEDFAIDAVHANTIMLREPLAAARRMGVPAVMHVRELVRHDVALCRIIGSDPEDVIASALESTDFVVANSLATARSFDKPGRTFVVPNTVEIADFEMGPPAGDESRITVMLVSSNLPKKGVLDFVEVAVRLADDTPQARFVLIGPETDFTRELRERIDAGNAPSNLVLGGYRADPALAIGEADIVVNLSRFQESFGRTVLEAMAAARPVIVYDWGALPELVREGETGFIVPFGDVDAAAARVRQLCSDPVLLRRMGEAGRRLATGRYGRDSYAEAMAKAYAQVLPAQTESAPRKLRLPARMPMSTTGERPRIAYFLWHFPVPSETFVLNELRLLVAQGHDVRVFCRQSPHPEFKPDFPIEWSTVEDADELAKALTLTARTIVHSHFVFPTVTRMVWPACERAGIPFTFIAHAQDIFRHSSDEQNRIGQIGSSKLCLRVLVPSRFHRAYLIERGVPADKLLINPNGIDSTLYRAGFEVDHAPRLARSVCAIHRFTAKKGLLALVEAGAQLAADGIEVHLYGYGDEGEAYRARIAELGATNVHLHGAVAGRDGLLEVFARHDLFACPAVRAPDGDMDGIPTVLMEAMASGLPVLATAISGIPDLVRDGVTGIVCEPGADGIAAAVRRFYALSDDRVAAMIEDAAAHVGRDFDAAGLTGALLRLWQGTPVDVMIVSWNNLPQLREVVRRLFAFTTAPMHLVVCDNGSDRDVTAYLCELYAARENVTVLLNRDNAKVGPGTNLCLAEGRAPYAVYVCGKEGFVLDFGWERRLVDYMDAHPRVGIAGTLCHAPSYLFGRQYPAGVAEFPRFRNRDFATDNPNRPFAHVQGGFFVVRRAMVDAIGGFSDDVPHNYTDVEFSYYAESLGWELGQAPGMLALYNKTRPGIFTRVDEGIAAIHPPTLDDLPQLDRIARVEGAFCNLCNWQGEQFEGREQETCPRCASAPSDRSLMRFLAESIFTYRRLPALAVGLGEAITPFWRQQFQGQPLSAAAAGSQLQAASQWDVASQGRALVYADLGQVEPDQVGDWLRECGRVLAPGGTLLLRAPDAGRRGLHAALAGQGAAAGWRDEGAWRRPSRVSRYDPAPLRVFRGPECA